MSDLSGKTAIVTGGCQGIGEAIARRFLSDGAAGVAIFDYNAEKVKETAAALDPTGEKVRAFACDVSKEEQVASAVAEALAAFGKIDILVNNAGITRDAMFHKMTNEQWDAVLGINLGGTFLMCKYLVGHMRERQYGRIVNISSVSAYGNVGQANYAASKAAVIGFTRTLAKENGPKNITANCIAPGYINTDMFRAVPQNIIDEYLKGIPLRRLAGADEVASVASFLASDDASYVSAQCLVVSGGSM